MKSTAAAYDGEPVFTTLYTYRRPRNVMLFTFVAFAVTPLILPSVEPARSSGTVPLLCAVHCANEYGRIALERLAAATWLPWFSSTRVGATLQAVSSRTPCCALVWPRILVSKNE